MHSPLQNIDTKEVELPETVFIRDIESRVFQSIAVQCLSKIDGVALLEGNFIDSLLGRDSNESVRGIYVQQDPKSHSVSVKLEINVAYGICIPEKAEEVQMKILEEVSSFTGLHVASVHVVFKNLFCPKQQQQAQDKAFSTSIMEALAKDKLSEFSEEF
ncbi:MAG: Asp23/Gls24 family envelope stress response protein [Chlamydiae bacterium]|nr:Asp23/Gls24 family envelope stress response protein [Chlamydiota bacterium]